VGDGRKYLLTPLQLQKNLSIQGLLKINTTAISKGNVDTAYDNKTLAIWISLELTSSETTLLGLWLKKYYLLSTFHPEKCRLFNTINTS